MQPSPQNSASMPVIVGYRLLRVLAEGITSIVYLAEQESLGRQVALKVMRPDALADEVSRRRFENEIRTVGRLDHPHIVGIFHIGRTAEGLPYYSMPYLANGHLGQRDFRNDEAGAREVLRGLLSALAYAHGRGVIHRDVKAENVLFDDAGGPLLADFGIALRRGYGSRVTSAGLAVGSTAYMAPEQARGEEVDPRADLYSVGVLAWEMLAGELPYQAQDALAMAVMHARDPIPRLPPHLRHWQRFMDRALAKYPLKRFHDANDMLQAIEQVPLPGRPGRLAPGAWLRAAVSRPRHVPGYAWIIGGLVLAALLGLGLQRYGSVPGTPAERFFRAGAETTSDTRPRLGATTAEDGTPVGDAAAPQSRAGHLIADAQRQIQARRLTTPAGDNAYDTLLEAIAEDTEHLELGPTAAALVSALGQEAARKLQAGDTSATVAALERAGRIGELVAPAAEAELETARRTLATAIEARVREAARQFDREAAQRSLEPITAIGLDTSAREHLAGLVRAIPALGQVVPGDPGRMTVQRGGDGAYALTRLHISRNDYARFAEATGREPALCRERASLLRMFSPRDWTSPGFEQSGSDAVVCVSWDDADAYARWLGQQNGARYRLPTAGEAGALPVTAGVQAVAEWLLDCNGDCRARAVAGDSWRRSGAGPRSTERGYDDVGFRLVREP
ncbi:bifunctional serine/threonine-protein kinase/formylglycine-generating enzyme family protein [Luteimonas sp. A478]